MVKITKLRVAVRTPLLNRSVKRFARRSPPFTIFRCTRAPPPPTWRASNRRSLFELLGRYHAAHSFVTETPDIRDHPSNGRDQRLTIRLQCCSQLCSLCDLDTSGLILASRLGPDATQGRNSGKLKGTELTVHRSDVCLTRSAPAKLHSKMAATTAALGEGWAGRGHREGASERGRDKERETFGWLRGAGGRVFGESGAFGSLGGAVGGALGGVRERLKTQKTLNCNVNPGLALDFLGP